MKLLFLYTINYLLRTNHEMPELVHYEDCEDYEDCDRWANDELALCLNHDYCYLDGRHPSTNDEDWELFLRSINEDYTEELYYIMRTRLDERQLK